MAISLSIRRYILVECDLRPPLKEVGLLIHEGTFTPVWDLLSGVPAQMLLSILPSLLHSSLRREKSNKKLYCSFNENVIIIVLMP
jgi:hypothetical protein